MTESQQAEFLDAAESVGIAADPIADYSGRGMFGEKTKAVTVASRDDAGIVAGILTARADNGRVVRFRGDSLGLDWVVY